jgi:hypothetical protein
MWGCCTQAGHSEGGQDIHIHIRLTSRAYDPTSLLLFAITSTILRIDPSLVASRCTLPLLLIDIKVTCAVKALWADVKVT